MLTNTQFDIFCKDSYFCEYFLIKDNYSDKNYLFTMISGVKI